MRHTILLIALVTLLLLPGVALGATLYGNMPPNQHSANEMTQWLQANIFVIPVPSTIEGATFYTFEGWDNRVGIDPLPWDGTIEWFVFPNVENLTDFDLSLPAQTPLASGTAAGVSRSPTGNTLSGFVEYEYSFLLGAPVPIPAGVPHWLGLHLAADYSHRDEIYWGTGPVGFGNGSHADAFGGDTTQWFRSGNEGAYFLSGTVAPIPEPTGLLLLGLGLLSAAALRRRTRRLRA